MVEKINPQDVLIVALEDNQLECELIDYSLRKAGFASTKRKFFYDIPRWDESIANGSIFELDSRRYQQVIAIGDGNVLGGSGEVALNNLHQAAQNTGIKLLRIFHSDSMFMDGVPNTGKKMDVLASILQGMMYQDTWEQA